MIDQSLTYFVERMGKMPVIVYVALLVVFLIGSVTLLLVYGTKKGLSILSGLVLFEYLVLLVCSTLVFRPSNEIHRYSLEFLWSYAAIRNGETGLLKIIIMNVLMFVPIGVLLSLLFKNYKLWSIILIGFCISISIELMQLLFKKGFAELDDIFHNTIGCIIGCVIYRLTNELYRCLTNRKLVNEL